MIPVVSDGWCTGGKYCVHIECEKLTYLIEKLCSGAEIGTGMLEGDTIGRKEWYTGEKLLVHFF